MPCEVVPKQAKTRGDTQRSTQSAIDERSRNLRSHASRVVVDVGGPKGVTSSEGHRAVSIERASSGTSLIDVLDRVLDKGIVIDAWVRVSLVGIDLITVEARVVVASIDTYLRYSEAVGAATAAARPAIGGSEMLDTGFRRPEDDGGNEGGGSSGAPALLHAETAPRRHPVRPRRTRRP